MRKNNWKLWNLQFVIAFNNLKDDLRSIPQRLKNDFDGSVTMLPIPDDAPKEIPRLIIPSKDNFRIEISKERISLSFENPKDSEKSIDDNKNDLKQKIKNILDTLKIDIAWTGLILRNLNENIEANNNMTKLVSELAKEIFKLTKKNNDLLLKYHKKIELILDTKKYLGDLNLELGSNIRDIATNNQIGNILILDINTRQSIIKKYNEKIINLFIDEVFSELDNTFSKLNPTDE